LIFSCGRLKTEDKNICLLEHDSVDGHNRNIFSAQVNDLASFAIKACGLSVNQIGDPDSGKKLVRSISGIMQKNMLAPDFYSELVHEIINTDSKTLSHQALLSLSVMKTVDSYVQGEHNLSAMMAEELFGGLSRQMTLAQIKDSASVSSADSAEKP